MYGLYRVFEVLFKLAAFMQCRYIRYRSNNLENFDLHA